MLGSWILVKTKTWVGEAIVYYLIMKCHLYPSSLSDVLQDDEDYVLMPKRNCFDL